MAQLRLLGRHDRWRTVPALALVNGAQHLGLLSLSLGVVVTITGGLSLGVAVQAGFLTCPLNPARVPLNPGKGLGHDLVAATSVLTGVWLAAVLHSFVQKGNLGLP